MNARRNAEIERTVAHENRVVAIAFSPDSALVATGAYSFYVDKSIRIWDVTSGQLIQQLPVRRPVIELVWSGDGKWLVAGCGEEPGVEAKGATLVWDTSDWKLVHEFESSDLSAVAVSPDSESLAVAVSDSKYSKYSKYGIGKSCDLMLYKLGNQDVIGTGSIPPESYGGYRAIASLTFTPDGRQLIAGGSVGLAVWKIPIERERKSPELIPGPEFSYMVTDGTELVCVTHGPLLRYAVSDLQPLQPSIPYRPVNIPSDQVKIDMSQKNRIVVGYQQVVQYLSWPDGAVVGSITAVELVSAIAISDDAAVVAIGTYGRVRLHDGHTGEFLRELIKP